MPNCALMRGMSDKHIETEKLGRLHNTESAAADLALGKRTLQELVHNREIAFIKIGRAIRFAQSDLDAFKNAKRVKARGWKGTQKTTNH